VDQAVQSWLDVAYVPQGQWLGELSHYELSMVVREPMLLALPVVREQSPQLSYWLQQRGTLDGVLVWERECRAFARYDLAATEGHIYSSALGETAYGCQRGSGRITLTRSNGEGTVLLLTQPFVLPVAEPDPVVYATAPGYSTDLS
jgi:hypothetical protein